MDETGGGVYGMVLRLGLSACLLAGGMAELPQLSPGSGQPKNFKRSQKQRACGHGWKKGKSYRNDKKQAGAEQCQAQGSAS